MHHILDHLLAEVTAKADPDGSRGHRRRQPLDPGRR